jgi:N4-gp56 family major capsid protein
MTKYETVSSRIGKWLGEILRVSEYVKTLEVSGPEIKPFEQNKGMEVIFRRWKNYGDLDWTFVNASTTESAGAFSASHLLAEGVSPSLDSITPVDISATVRQYGMAYGFTDKTFNFHEDDIPAEMSKQLGQRKGTLEEMIDFAALQAGTQVLYGGGGLSRTAVNREITLMGLRTISQQLLLNSAPMMTSGGTAGTAYGSAPPEAGWCTFCNTAALNDARNIMEGGGWIPREKYAGKRAVHPLERGSVEDFAFLFSPHLQPVLGAGAAVGASGLRSTNGSVDVYMSLIMAKEAWGKLNPRSANTMKPSMLRPGDIDKSDFLGQRGVFGMKFWASSLVLRDGFMYRYEHGVKSLSGGY